MWWAPPPYRGGFPGYATFVLALGIVPSVGLLRSTKPFVNWKAFSMTVFVLLLVSILWEVTLGVPFRWWGYREEQMVGLAIEAWSDLPIEAVIVWFAAAFTVVVFYEAMKLRLAMGGASRSQG